MHFYNKDQNEQQRNLRVGESVLKFAVTPDTDHTKEELQGVSKRALQL
jgi:hypothetical protein